MYQASWIVQYSVFFPKEVKTALNSENKNTLKLLSANVLMTNENYHGLINIIKDYDPDILVTIETNKKWEKNLRSIESNFKKK